LRIDLPFCLYHVMSRTNSGDTAFRNRRDISRFLFYLSRYAGIFHFRIQAYCLMRNHFHLLLESGDEAGLSELMRRLLTAYTVYYNRRYERHGHLFQGRFKSLVVDKSQYLLTLSRYIHLNPVEGDRKRDPETYFASSYRFYLLGNEPEWLHTGEILQWFHGDRSLYGRFVREGFTEDNFPAIYKRRFVGGRAFGERVTARIRAGSSSRESSERSPHGKTDPYISQADRIVEGVARALGCRKQRIREGRNMKGIVGFARTVVIGLLKETFPWTNKQIAAFMSLKTENSVLHHVGRIRKNEKMKGLMERIKKENRL